MYSSSRELTRLPWQLKQLVPMIKFESYCVFDNSFENVRQHCIISLVFALDEQVKFQDLGNRAGNTRVFAHPAIK